ncbi:MAG: hypothetical protein O2954_03800 [bacterium]|nr:hypothetical protein [bacterium]
MPTCTNFTTISLPNTENALSRRYLSIITRWIPVAMRYYTPWPDRPDCGYFFGGVFAYGLDVSMSLTSIALAASSPEFDPALAGASADELRQTVRRGLRFLCFTHDTGPEDCVRPNAGWGASNTKWGERGKGFFQESQCGRTISEMAMAAALVRDLLDAEDRSMLAAIATDYLERYSEMDPKAGVYFNTQTEENAWTALGLVGSLVLVPDHPQKAALWERAKLWMFRTNTRPEDAFDQTPFADGKTVSQFCGRTFTAHPDGTAENHGFVHPSYMGSGIVLPGKALNLLHLYQKEVPPHIFWRMQDVYHLLKSWSDSSGAPHCPQGMDWPYFAYPSECLLHTVGNLYLNDADAALLEQKTLQIVERSSAAHGGRMVTEEVVERTGFGARPTLMIERMCDHLAQSCLAHRIHGEGQSPSTSEDFERRMRGVTVYPQGGTLIHRHTHGITSFSWRNRTMILPAPPEGREILCAADTALLAKIRVSGKAESTHPVALKIRENPNSASAVLIQDLAERTVRRTVCFATLPDGTCLTAEWLTARESITVERVEQGRLNIINDGFFGHHKNLRGHRTLYHPNGQHTFEGYVTGNESDDETLDLPATGWINIDNRFGIMYRSSAPGQYRNHHAFNPWRAVEDTLSLNLLTEPHSFQPGEEIAHLITLFIPEQSHAETQILNVLNTLPNAFAAETSTYLCAFSLSNQPVEPTPNLHLRAFESTILSLNA